MGATGSAGSTGGGWVARPAAGTNPRQRAAMRAGPAPSWIIRVFVEERSREMDPYRPGVWL